MNIHMVKELGELCLKYGTEDAHLARACELTGKPLNEVTPTERQQGKNYNFKKVYGWRV